MLLILTHTHAHMQSSVKYRDTDKVVREYPVAVASYSGEETNEESENEPLVTRYQSTSIGGASGRKLL